jgi:hypothetical protein
MLTNLREFLVRSVDGQQEMMLCECLVETDTTTQRNVKTRTTHRARYFRQVEGGQRAMRAKEIEPGLFRRVQLPFLQVFFAVFEGKSVGFGSLMPHFGVHRRIVRPRFLAEKCKNTAFLTLFRTHEGCRRFSCTLFRLENGLVVREVRRD